MYKNDYGNIITSINKNGIEHEQAICPKSGLVSHQIVYNSFYYKIDPEKEELLKFKTGIYCQVEKILKNYKIGNKISNNNLTNLLNALRKNNYINLSVKLEDLEKIVLACIFNKTFIVGWTINKISKKKTKKIFITRDKNVFDYNLFKREIEKYKRNNYIPIINTTGYTVKNRYKKQSQYNNIKKNLIKNTIEEEYIIHSEIKSVICPCCGQKVSVGDEKCWNCKTKVER